MSKHHLTIGAFVVIIRENAVLLCHRTDRDAWNLPGGGVERGESPWAAAVREVAEEVGVTVSLSRLVGVYHKSAQNDIVFTFTGTVINGTPRPSDEADRVAFFPVSALPENLLPKHRERIMHAISARDIVLCDQ